MERTSERYPPDSTVKGKWEMVRCIREIRCVREWNCRSLHYAALGRDDKGKIGSLSCIGDMDGENFGKISIRLNGEGQMANGSLHSRDSLRPAGNRRSLPSGRGDKGEGGSSFCICDMDGRRFGMYPSNLTRKREWERAIGIPEA
jgi:hypothetical protein